MVNIPLFPMTQQLAVHYEQLQAALNRVLSSGVLVNGPELASFEIAWAKTSHANFSIGVASGYDALLLSLKAAGIKTGSIVGVPAHTCPATALAVAATGALIVPIEVDCETALLDINWLETSGLVKKLDAIVPVNLYGNTLDYSRLATALDPQTWIIEDNAQGHGIAGAMQQIGHHYSRLISATSFYPTKNLGALGEAGAISTNSSEIADLIKSLRNYGTGSARFVSDHVSGNHRLDEMQAAFLNVFLPNLQNINDRKVSNYQHYITAVDGNEYLQTLPDETVRFGNGHLAIIRTKQRSALQRHLNELGIQTMVHYPVPVHKQPALASQLYDHGLSLDNAEAWANEVLTIPNHQLLSDQEVETVINALRSFNIS